MLLGAAKDGHADGPLGSALNFGLDWQEELSADQFRGLVRELPPPDPAERPQTRGSMSLKGTGRELACIIHNSFK